MKTQTIEKTGKGLKLQIVLCWVAFFAGVVWQYASCQTEPHGNGGAILIAVSIVWYAITRFRIWWHHG